VLPAGVPSPVLLSERRKGAQCELRLENISDVERLPMIRLARLPALAVLVLTSLLLTPCVVFAYLDPGTTGVLYQVGYFLFYGFLALLAILFRPIKAFFSARRKKDTGAKELGDAQPPDAA